MILKTNINGITFLNGRKIASSVGRGGVGIKQSEGDGITPVGKWTFEQVFYRADRIQKPKTILSTLTIEPNHGWCDEANDLQYNKLIKLPYSASHENLWRDDCAYNLILTTNYNRDPIISGKGSAIFIHLARTDNEGDFLPTEGCLGLQQADLEELLSTITPSSYWQVGDSL